jgi:hypothetical protein
MNEPTLTPAPARRRWRRKLLWVAIVLVALLVAAFLVVSSGAFLKGVVLPRVGRALNANLAAEQITFRPFSELELRDVKLTPVGAEPVFTAGLVRARYHLLALLGGRIAVDELTVESPVVNVIENADGTCNLDPLLRREKVPAAKAAPGRPGQPPRLDVKLVSLKNATFRQITTLKGGGRQTTEVSGLDLALTGLRNGAAGKLKVSAAVSAENTAPDGAGRLRGQLKAEYDFDLTTDLKPARLNGNGTFTVEAATGRFADFNALSVALACEATPTEVKDIALRFTRAGEPLGELRASGPFDAAKTEGKLTVTLLSLDRRVLNMFGAAHGLDFGPTVVNSTNVVELTQGGSRISASGRLNAANVQITRQGQTTPTLDLACNYAGSLDRAAQTARLESFSLLGAQNGQPLLRGGLTSPMTLGFGGTAANTGDATLDLTLTRLNLADWRPFLGEAARAGLANATLKLVSQQGGQQLIFNLDAGVDQLSARWGSNEIAQADVRLTVRGAATNLQQFKLETYRLELAQQGQNAMSVSGAGTFNRATQDADLQVAVQAALARLLAILPQPGVAVSAGTLDFTGRVTSTGNGQAVAGQLTLSEFAGACGDYRFKDFGVSADCNFAKRGDALEIRKAAGQLWEGRRSGGRFEVTGNVDVARNSGQFNAKLTDLDEHGLRPFLASALGDKTLVSASLNATASANRAANGDATLKAEARLANLVVQDPNGALPATPLETRVQVDTAITRQVAQIRNVTLSLTPTDRAKNELNLTGSVDFSQSNALTGTVKLAAESLDVTRYYDLFGGQATNAATGSAAPPASAPPPGDANPEPAPVKLPFRNFTLHASIGQFYLREVAMTNLLTTAKIDGSRVVLNPFTLTLNGAPVAATVDLDLSVPGYKYAVALDTKPVPLAPLVNSFQPERKGQIGGTTTVRAKFTGAGITGANLKQNLTGDFSLLSTNLNLSIANVRHPLINGVLNVLMGIPDLIRNPTALLGNLLSQATGRGGGGWADQITAAPIDAISVNAQAGNGRLQVRQAEVRSAAFLAETTGDVAFAPILTNSTIQFPVSVSLSRPLGEKIGLVTADTPTNAAYVPMPQFLTMTGTLGKPGHRINAAALAVLATRAGSGLVKEIGGATGTKVEGLLQGVGGLLGGHAAGPAPGAPATNAPSTNVPPPNPVNELLNLFKKPKN